MYRVFVGVGHGGTETGAVANGLIEKDLNLVIASKCTQVLREHGVEVLMSRTKDESDTLTSEISECNAYEPDLAIDIHNNASGGDGAEVFYSVVGGKGKDLATNILDEIVKIGQNSRGIKTRKNEKGFDFYGFIRCTYAPACIVECAFLDSKDHEIVDTLEEQNAFGTAIAKGVLKTLGIQYKAHTKSKVDTAIELLKQAISILEV